MHKWWIAFFLFLYPYSRVAAQDSIPSQQLSFPEIAEDSTLKKDTVDVMTILRHIFKKPEKKNPPRFAILPAVGFNPTFGLTLGFNFTGVFHTKRDLENRWSSIFFNSFYSTKKNINFQLRQNVFFDKNRYYLIGNAQVARLISETYRPYNSEDEFPVKYGTIKINQQLYRQVAGNFYAGAGLAFEFYRKIVDEELNTANNEFTPHYNYSVLKDFDTLNYNTNGLMFGLLYNSQEHPLRSYGGWFANIWVRFNTSWLGSAKNQSMLFTDIRKYFSLSKRNPEHVLAFWNLSAINLSGDLPYLALPATGLDLYNRSGRAYAIGRFRGKDYFYLESEYRFPISRRKLLSGIAFINVQTYSLEGNYSLFTRYSPSAGAGLRILINKRTRSNLCLDYAVGLDGKSGVFFGLNEVF